MNNEKKKQTKKLSGFYIALCCCVLMIGVAGYFTEKKTDGNDNMAEEEITETENREVFSDSSEGITVPTMPPSPTLAPTQAPADEDITESSDKAQDGDEARETADFAVDNPDMSGDAIEVSGEQPAFILPLSGEVIQPFTEVLSYSPLMGDWRAHPGIDIAAEKGCSVQSVAAGVVEKVYDNTMGKCVEISHAGGFSTKYMCMGTTENLTEGKEIQSGEVIGTVGDSKGEDITQTHLHFEMSRNGVNVNPSDFLPH